jgi:uncharacterized protein YjbI with pentapeptide repeats
MSTPPVGRSVPAAGQRAARWLTSGQTPRFVGLITAFLLAVVLLPALLLVWLGATRYTWSVVLFGSLFISIILLPAFVLTWVNRREPTAVGQLVSLLAGAAVAFTVLFVQIVEDRSRESAAEEASVRLAVGQQRDLRGIDLSNRNLSNAYLYRKDFREAVFHETNLKNAVLSYSRLEDAHMHHAHLNSADLTEAKMQRAELQHARLNEANLSDAVLRGANLSYADLDGTILRGADLTGAILLGVKNADFTGSIGGPSGSEKIRDPRILAFQSELKERLTGWRDASRSTIAFFQSPDEMASFQAEVEGAGGDLSSYSTSKERDLERSLPGYDKQYSRFVQLRDGSRAYLLRLTWRHGSAHPTDEVRLVLVDGTRGYEYVGSIRTAAFERYRESLSRIFSLYVNENVLNSGANVREGGGGG